MAHRKLRLGVNIDHAATLRNARGGIYPSPVDVALCAQDSGADGITAHLREDRRHIRDSDIFALVKLLDIPLNFEMAATKEMLDIALSIKPHAVCIVPEKREEVTTEGGLAVCQQKSTLQPIIHELKQAGIKVSLFIDADENEVTASMDLGADIVELHTGQYCHAQEDDVRKAEHHKIASAARYADVAGLEVHAGHGLSFETVKPIAAIPEMRELNIGHFIMSASVFTGLKDVITHMHRLMDLARQEQ